eukprot:jgi/Mesvir1/21752/Mv04157-RA.1
MKSCGRPVARGASSRPPGHKPAHDPPQLLSESASTVPYTAHFIRDATDNESPVGGTFWGQAVSRKEAKTPLNARQQKSRPCTQASAQAQEPLMVRAAKLQPVERQPAWMMRQAGRYQKVYRDLAKKHPSFRERSETTDLIVQISLQPWESFKPDGVILFSDILTPLPSIGVQFEIDDVKGPILEKTIRSAEDIKMLRPLDLKPLHFVGDSLTLLRKEVGTGAAVIGFVGSPWTLATYIVEGKSSREYLVIKRMCYSAPELLHKLLSHVADAIGEYCCYQVRSGAQVLQLFDSWGGQLPPREWEKWSKPYIMQVMRKVREQHPGVPVTVYANGSGGLLERIKTTGADVVGVDWTVDMADARTRLGHDVALQGNVDPAVLFATPEAIEDAIKDVLTKAGRKGHILNLGHGVLVGTPEENVAHFFNTNRKMLNK